MKIAVISTKKLTLKIKGQKIQSFVWSDIGGKEINLRDFDGVILDLSELNEKADGVDWVQFEDVLNHEVAMDVLYRKGSFIYVIGNPFTNGHLYSIATLLGMNLKYIRGKGDSIVKAKDFGSSPHKGYLETIKKYDYSFSAIGASTIVREKAEAYSRKAGLRTTPYLGNRSGYTIAADVEIVTYKVDYKNYASDHKSLHTGRITLLPPADMELAELVKLLLATNVDADSNVAPDWIDGITVNGQAEIDELLSENQKATSALVKEKTALVEKKAKLREPLEILYRSGKPLEGSVKAVLKKMGLQVIEPESSEKVEFYIEHGEHKFVVEVKSTTGEVIDQKGLRQAIDWQNDAFDETGEDYKALVVVSTQFDKPLNERTSSVLPDNLTKYAVKRAIAVVTVKDLFNVSQAIEQGAITLSNFTKALANCSGQYELKLGSDKKVDHATDK